MTGLECLSCGQICANNVLLGRDIKHYHDDGTDYEPSGWATEGPELQGDSGTRQLAAASRLPNSRQCEVVNDCNLECGSRPENNVELENTSMMQTSSFPPRTMQQTDIARIARMLLVQSLLLHPKQKMRTAFQLM